MKKLWNKLKIYLKPFINWRFLISFGAAWMITNGWSYVFVICGPIFHITWMTTIGAAYQAFLWMPFTPEKLVTIPIAIFFHTRLFKNDKKTHEELNQMYEQARNDFTKIKEKFRKRPK